MIRLNTDTSELDADSKQIKENRKSGLDRYNKRVRGILDFYYSLLERENLMDFISFEDRKQYNRDIRSFLKNNKTRKQPLDTDDTKRALLIAFNNKWYKKNGKEGLLLKLGGILKSQAYLTDAIKRRGDKILSIKTAKKYHVLNYSGNKLDVDGWGYFTEDSNNNLIHIGGKFTKEVKVEESRRMGGGIGKVSKDEYFTKNGNIKGEYGFMVGLHGGTNKRFVGEEIE